MNGEEPELTFSGDFTERLTAEVRAADILTIHYDLKRMSECERGSGRYLQYLTGFYQVDDQQVESFDYIPSYTRASALQTARIEVPQGQELSIWFKSVDTEGCEAIDDNFGQRYIVPIAGGEALEGADELFISFEASGDVTQRGVLESGSTVTVRYDIERLSECESVERGLPQWGITGHFKTDLSAEERFVVTETINGELATRDAELKIPEGDVLYIRFTASNRYGCLQEDEGVSLDLTQPQEVLE